LLLRKINYRVVALLMRDVEGNSKVCLSKGMWCMDDYAR